MLISAITTTVLLFSQVVVDNKDPYSPLPQIAVQKCKHLKNASPKKKEKALAVAKILHKVEADEGIPGKMRGMILAAACLESGFSPKAKGDRKFSKSKKKPMAIGVLQMWPIYEKAYGVDRNDPQSSAVGWLRHIKRQVPKVKRQCKYKTLRRIWVAAWVTGIRYKKPGGRCHERPKHYRFFLKIRRIYEAQTKKSLTKSGK